MSKSLFLKRIISFNIASNILFILHVHQKMKIINFFFLSCSKGAIIKKSKLIQKIIKSVVYKPNKLKLNAFINNMFEKDVETENYNF